MFCINHDQEVENTYASYVRDGNSYCEECYVEKYIEPVARVDRIIVETARLRAQLYTTVEKILGQAKKDTETSTVKPNTGNGFDLE